MKHLRILITLLVLCQCSKKENETVKRFLETNDVTNTATIYLLPDFPNITDYEYKIGNMAFQDLPPGTPIVNGKIVHQVGNVAGTYQIRVKAGNNRPAGAIASGSFTVTAPSTVYAVAVAGQSNASGLAPQTALSSAQKGPFAKTLIWNDDTNAAEALLIADASTAGGNEQGLNGGLSGMPPRADGATIPAGLENYYDGFGFEQRFAELLQASGTTTKYYFKANVERPTSTNGSSIAVWQSDLFAAYETQYNRFKAQLASENKTLVTEYLLWNQGEADQNNASYVSDLNALMTRFKTLFNNPNLKIIIVRTKGASNQYSAVGSRQMDYVLQESAAQFIDIPNHTYLSDNVHTSANSMIAGGEIWYNMTYGTKDVAVPTVVSRTVLNATTIRVVFSEPVLSDLTGVSFQENGAALTPTARTGNGTNTLDYTVSTILNGDVITHTYDATPGKIMDFSRNKLASFTNQPVTNNLASSDSTAPVLQAARTENEYSLAKQIILPYNEALTPDSVPAPADVVTSPVNTLQTATVTGQEMVLTFANDFPRCNTPILITTTNNKIKDIAGNPAANLTNQAVTNWIAATAPGFTVVPFPGTTGVMNTNNWWRASSQDNFWGHGSSVGLKLTSGTNGAMAMHYAKPGVLGALGFKQINYFGYGINTFAGSGPGDYFDGFFVDANSKVTWIRVTNKLTNAGIIGTAVLGNWYRVARTNGAVTLDESTDGTNWTTLFTFTYTAADNHAVLTGDIYGMYDLFGIVDNKLPYPQQQGMVSAPANTVAQNITFSTVNKFGLLAGTTWGPSGTGLTDGYGYTGLASKKLPAATTGRIFGVFQPGVNGQGNSSSLGFKVANTLGGNSALLAAINVDSTGKVATIRNGTYNSTVLYTLTGQTFLGIVRDGATGAMKLQRSSDALAWVDLFTFSEVSTADLFIGADTYYNAAAPAASGRIVNPQGEGLIIA